MLVSSMTKKKISQSLHYGWILSRHLSFKPEDGEAKNDEFGQVKNLQSKTLYGQNEFDMLRWRCATVE